MKSTILTFCLIGLFCLSASAQRSKSAEIEWGQELREPASTFISEIISVGNAGFFAVRRKRANTISGEQVYIEQYDNDLNLKRSQKLDLKVKGKQRDFEDIVMVGRELYLLSSFNNQAKKKNYLFLQKINRKGLRLSKDFQMIAETDARDKYREGTFDLVLSKDSSKVLIYNQLPFKKNEPERFAFRIFDSQFNELWSRNIVLPYSDNQFSVEEYRIDNNGNVYLLGVIYEDRSNFRRQGRPTYQYVVLAYTQDGEEAREYKIDIADKFITDLTFRVANDGNLVCSGFYSEKGTYSIKGTYFFKLDAQTERIYNKNLKEFDFDFLTEYMSPNKKVRMKKAEIEGNERRAPELYNYALDELILRSDGGALLVAEQFYVYERQDFNQPYYGYGFGFYDPYYRRTTTADIFYNFNDIIVVNIRPNGEIEWTARIPKQQETVNDGGYYSSYSHAVVQDKIYFVYNDNARNFEGQREGKRNRIYNFDGRNSVIALSELRKDGTVETIPLFNNRDAAVVTRPMICKQVGRKKMRVYGEWGRSYRFANLIFK